MSEVISARLKGEELERYREEVERLDEEESTSDLVRDLIERGLDARQVPLVARLGVSNRVGARIEDAREAGESEEKVVRRFLREAVDARDGDVLDAIDAPDELRDRVEGARKEGEATEDTVRRLLREGADAADENTLSDRLFAAFAMGLLMGIPTIFAALGRVDQAVTIMLTIMIFVLVDPLISALWQKARAKIRRVIPT